VAVGSKAAARTAEAAQRRRKRLRRRLRRVALALVGVGLAAVAAWAWRQTRPRATIPVGIELPSFALVDENDRPLTRTTLAGRSVVFSFAFLHGAADTPSQLNEMRALADDVRTGPLEGRVALLTLTVAPEEDSPDHLRAAATAVGASPPWSIASGAPSDVEALLDALDVDRRQLQAERAKYGSPIFPSLVWFSSTAPAACAASTTPRAGGPCAGCAPSCSR
jgi:cytochrome oxidase Cu insertion factor (SCO1/SenC/PrrC family)